MIFAINIINNNFKLTSVFEIDINSFINLKIKLILSQVLKTFKNSKKKNFKNIMKNIKFF